jgi:hypothetical protein
VPCHAMPCHAMSESISNIHVVYAYTHTHRWLLAGGPVDALWERDPQELVRQLEACIKVCSCLIYI